MQNQYFNSNHPLKPYTHSLGATEGTLPPTNAVRDKEPVIMQGKWPCWNGKDWKQVEDHRKREGYPELVARYGDTYPQEGTEYWLPGDTHETPARLMKEVGPLPEGWSDTPPPPTLEEAKEEKLQQIDSETSAAIRAGFDYEVDGQVLHFAYDTHDQQNFADTANMVNFSLKGIPGVQESIPWNGWKIEKDETGVVVSCSLVRIDLDANAFLALYMQGAMMHKAGLMELGGQRKAQVDAATTIEELEDI